MAGLHVVSALVAKRAALAGEISLAEKRLAQLRADLAHVDAVLRLFDAGAEPETIRPKLPRRRTRWFADGELPRRVLHALRTAPEPPTTRDIALAIMAEKCLELGDARTLAAIDRRVMRYLHRQRAAGVVERVAVRGRGVVWRVAG